MSIFSKMRRSAVKLRSRFLQARFIWTEKGSHKQLRIGRKVTFHVPARGGGKGTLIIGDKSSFGYGLAPSVGSGEVLLQPRKKESEIIIGEGNAISNNFTAIANERIVIGNGCRIGDQVMIFDCDFHEINPATRGRSCGTTAPVILGNNVWLGTRVMVLKGVTIGDNSVIGAMSLVTKSIPANCIAAGNPARVIRMINET